jgi:hypothetical protein
MAINTESRSQQPAGRRLVCVLGMHRSGTSAVTQLLHRLGAQTGSHLLDAMAGVNDDGFWEDSRVVALNERLLAASASRWQDHAAPGAVDPQILAALRREAGAWFAEQYATPGTWVIKDPRLCRLLPFWLPVWREAGFEICFVNVLRHPYAVAKSLHRRDRVPIEYGVLLWLVYTLEAMSHSAGQPGIVATFDAFAQNPLQLPRLLENHCGVQWSLAPASWEAVASAAVRPDLRHQDDTLPQGVALPDLAAFAATVYDTLRSYDALGASAATESGAAPATSMLPAVAATLTAGLAALLDRRGDELAMLRNLTNEIMALSAESVRIGELHSRALSVIQEKDAGLRECDRIIEDRNQLIADIKHLRFWRILPRFMRRVGRR